MAAIKSDWVYRSTLQTADTLIKHIAEIYLLSSLHLRNHNNITTWTFILTIQVNRFFFYTFFSFIRFFARHIVQVSIFRWEKFKWLEYHLSFLCCRRLTTQFPQSDNISRSYRYIVHGKFFFIESSAITNSSEKKKQFAPFIVWRS